jgi:branched-chain amino acid transport system substrate-binding protein
VKTINFTVFIFVLILIAGFKIESSDFQIQNKEDKTIKIGLLIQDKNSIEAKIAAEAIIKKVNSKGGINGRPLQLIIRSMEGPWGTGSKQAVDLIFNEKVWAIVGSHDGRNAHLVEQATVKTRVVFLSAWASDPTLSQAFVPWFFNCVPNDLQQADALIEEIYNKRKINKIALLYDSGYDSKLAAATFAKVVKKKNKTNPQMFLYDNSSKDFKRLVDQIQKTEIEGIVLVGQETASSKIIQELIQRKIKLPVFGSLSILSENGMSNQDLKNYENVVLISYMDNIDKKSKDFHNELKKINGKTPGPIAAYMYDALNLIIEAIKKSGLNRDLVKNSMFKIQHNGITGQIQFDAKGNRLGKVNLMEIKKGTPFILK